MPVNFRTGSSKDNKNFINHPVLKVPEGFKTANNEKSHYCPVLRYMVSRCRVVSCGHYAGCVKGKVV